LLLFAAVVMVATVSLSVMDGKERTDSSSGVRSLVLVLILVLLLLLLLMMLLLLQRIRESFRFRIEDPAVLRGVHSAIVVDVVVWIVMVSIRGCVSQSNCSLDRIGFAVFSS